MKDSGIVIVGGGLAARRCAETLRRRGYEGPVPSSSTAIRASATSKRSSPSPAFPSPA